MINIFLTRNHESRIPFRRQIVKGFLERYTDDIGQFSGENRIFKKVYCVF